MHIFHTHTAEATRSQVLEYRKAIYESWVSPQWKLAYVPPALPNLPSSDYDEGDTQIMDPSRAPGTFQTGIHPEASGQKET